MSRHNETNSRGAVSDFFSGVRVRDRFLLFRLSYCLDSYILNVHFTQYHIGGHAIKKSLRDYDHPKTDTVVNDLTRPMTLVDRPAFLKS